MNSKLIRAKLESIAKNRMKKENIDAWIIFTREGDPDPLADEFGLGSCAWRSAGIFTQDLKSIAIVGSFDSKQVEKCGLYDQVISYGSAGAADLLASISKKEGLRTVALNFSDDFGLADGLTISMKKYLSKYVKSRFVSSEDLVIDLRARLLPEEVSKMRKAVKLTEEIFDEAQNEIIKEGVKDKEIFDYIQKLTKENGASFSWHESMDPSVCVGTHEPQHLAYNNVVFKNNQLLRIDYGISLDGYCSDLQRVYFSGSTPEKLKEDFATARRANDAAIKALTPNTTGYLVDKAGRDVVLDGGFADYKHALGHAIARADHEIGPLLGPRWRNRYGYSMDKIIGRNIMFTIEPTIYSKYGGINLEQEVLVNEEGMVERVSHTQEGLMSV
jgi:Xaa-Pro aminopeptidase